MSTSGHLTAELMALLGPEVACRLLDIYGGTLLYIPSAAVDHPLSAAIGEASARLLCARYGGSRLPIPLGHRLTLARRDAAIRQDRQNGLSIADLVKKYRLSRRRIFVILSSASHATTPPEVPPLPQQQLSLF